MRFLAFLGRCFISLAGMALLVAAGLFVVGGFLVTWPILRLPPRQRHMKAAMDLLVAVQGAAVVFKEAVYGAAQDVEPADPSVDDSH